MPHQAAEPLKRYREEENRIDVPPLEQRLKSMNILVGKVAIITGASKGIGAGIAKAFSAEGATVRRKLLIKQGRGRPRAFRNSGRWNGNAVAIQASVSNPEDVKRLFAETKAAFGRLDILVNNAGVFKFEPFEDIAVAEFNREFSTNVLGPILTIQEAIKQFGFEEGRVINISSFVGSHSLPNGVLYSATKAAVENLTQGLSAELGSRRIQSMPLRQATLGAKALLRRDCLVRKVSSTLSL